MLKKLIAPALFLAFATAGAMAAPVAPAPQLAVQPNLLEQVQMRHHGPGPGRPHMGPPRRFHYAPGARLRAAPHGWRRYGARPYDWRTRGCIIVGAIWFCP